MSSARGGKRFGRGKSHDSLVGASVKVRLGQYKGCKGRVLEIKGTMARVELETQMKIVTVERSHLSENMNVNTTRFREQSMGNETPLYPCQTPMRGDSGGSALNPIINPPRTTRVG